MKITGETEDTKFQEFIIEKVRLYGVKQNNKSILAVEHIFWPPLNITQPISYNFDIILVS